MPLLRDGHYKNAAREAMVLVEKALRRKGRVEDMQFGKQLIVNLFAGKQGVKLRVPLGDELQKQAELYFKGVFSYYRNYVAHDGDNISERIAYRVLIVASELLELIDATELTLTEKGGLDALVRVGNFGSPERLASLLKLLDGYHMPDETYDGLFESLAENGFDQPDLDAVFYLDLVRMHSALVGDHERLQTSLIEIEKMEWFELTDLGKDALIAADNALQA